MTARYVPAEVMSEALMIINNSNLAWYESKVHECKNWCDTAIRHLTENHYLAGQYMTDAQVLAVATLIDDPELICDDEDADSLFEYNPLDGPTDYWQDVIDSNLIAIEEAKENLQYAIHIRNEHADLLVKAVRTLIFGEN